MAFSPLRFKAVQHGRSLSLPSKSLPASSQFHENLSIVKACEATSSSLSSFENRVNGLINVYSHIHESLLLPQTQQIIPQEPQEKWIDQLLDGHIRLLDACSAAKDLFSHTITKHDIQELLSALRRKDFNGIHCFLTARRNLKKMIQKSLKELRSSGNKYDGVSLEKENGATNLVHMLKEAEMATFSMLESLLCYVMGTKTHTRQSEFMKPQGDSRQFTNHKGVSCRFCKPQGGFMHLPRGWSLVSKLVQSKKISHQGEEKDVNEFKKVDDFLLLKQNDDAQIEELMNQLKEMDSSIQILEEKLECFFRQLIKTRVSLLNILNH